MKHGVKHKVPEDLKRVLVCNKDLLAIRYDLTVLSRNEWICFIISVKKEETRKKHIERLKSDLLKGKRRPCCWASCPHR